VVRGAARGPMAAGAVIVIDFSRHRNGQLRGRRVLLRLAMTGRSRSSSNCSVAGSRNTDRPILRGRALLPP
jgi:hypothetical protein